MKAINQHFLIILAWVFLLSGCQDESDPVNPAVNTPIANAGDDRQAEIGSIVKLDASGSSDPQNDPLTYNWSFISKPVGSTTAIVGIGREQAEFTMDKAGVYTIQLKVSDGKTEATDDVNVTNRTPILNQVDTSTKGNLDDDLADIGRTIEILGDFFSGDINENTVTIGGINYLIEELNPRNSDDDYMRIAVPDNAQSGDLVVSVGEESVTWPTPIKIVNRPVADFKDLDPSFEERERNRSSDYKEIGMHFRPLTSGHAVAFSARTPNSKEVRVTLWEVATKTPLTFEVLQTRSQGQTVYKNFDSRVLLEAGKEYLITLNANQWYFHINSPRKPIYPQTLSNNFEYLGTVAGGSTSEIPVDLIYPEAQAIDDFMVLGADIVFAPDPQQ